VTAIITEPFTYSNGALDTVSSGVWFQVTTDDMSVSTNKIVHTNIAGQEAVYVHTTSIATADQYAELVVTGGNNYSETGPLCRKAANNDSTKTFYLAPLSNGGLQLYRVVGGAYTEIGAYAAGSASGTVRLRCEGSTIKVLLDGVERISVTDTNIASGNYTGVESYSNTGTVASGDNFEAGNLTGAAAASLLIRRRRQLFQRGLITR
jgi:hypothetical protein